MVLDDLATQVETYTCCLVGSLGGEEGVEYLAENLLFDANAVVAYLQNVVPVSHGGS